MLLQLPALDQLFISVKRIEVTHPQCLTFFLHRPDYWLAHRLASYCSHLAHPQFPLIGTGPFRLTQFTAELVRLESHDYYHLRHPLLKAVEYWITPPLFEKDMGTSCRHPVQITIGKPEELQRVSQVSSGISLGFCYLTLRKSLRLSLWQARKVISIIHQSGLLQTLEVGENLITASHALLPGWTIPHWQVPDEVKLPKTLTLVYHLPIELHTMAERLQATLAAEGCELTIIFHNAKKLGRHDPTGTRRPHDGRQINWRSTGIYPGAMAALRSTVATCFRRSSICTFAIDTGRSASNA